MPATVCEVRKALPSRRSAPSRLRILPEVPPKPVLPGSLVGRTKELKGSSFTYDYSDPLRTFPSGSRLQELKDDFEVPLDLPSGVVGAGHLDKTPWVNELSQFGLEILPSTVWMNVMIEWDGP